ncbi:zinc transporter ZntB [Sphingomonas sp. ID0503]|uniref:zinc transporter ZntB n=1 Tax=Sphingomonas sp. ID0503 TaxID=3399691 RepID=UPI003AFB2398
MNGFAYILFGDTVRSVEPEEAVASKGEHVFVWIHLEGNEDARAWTRERLTLPETVEDALFAIETRPRLATVGEGALVNLRGRAKDPAEDPLVSVRLWAEAGRVFSTGRRRIVTIRDLRHCMEAGQIRDPGDLIALLASEITRDLDPEVARLGDEVDACEGELGAADIYRMRRQITAARAQAIEYRRFLVPQREAIERLATLSLPWIEEADRAHLREAADRAARMAEELEAIRERSALLHEQLTDLHAEEIDRRGLLISIVAFVFLPLTFLTGLLGMNVEGIPYAHEPWAFWGVVGVCVAIALAVVGYFTVKHWFRA